MKENCPLTYICHESWKDYDGLDQTCEIRKALENGELNAKLSHLIAVKIFEFKVKNNVSRGSEER